MFRSRRVLAIGGKQRILRLDRVCIYPFLCPIESFLETKAANRLLL